MSKHCKKYSIIIILNFPKNLENTTRKALKKFNNFITMENYFMTLRKAACVESTKVNWCVNEL